MGKTNYLLRPYAFQIRDRLVACFLGGYLPVLKKWLGTVVRSQSQERGWHIHLTTMTTSYEKSKSHSEHSLATSSSLLCIPSWHPVSTPKGIMPADAPATAWSVLFSLV